MALLARRIETLGTENAFSLGVDIQRVVDRGMDVVRLNIGEPDVDAPPHINQVGAEQILAGNSHYTDPQGDPGSPAGDREPRDPNPRRGGRPGTGGRHRRGEALHRLHDADLRRSRRRGHLPQPWVPHLRVLGDLRGRDATTPPPVGGARVRLHRGGPGCPHHGSDQGHRAELPVEPDRRVFSEEDLRDIASVIRTRCGPHVRIYSDEIYEHTLFDGRGHRSIIGEEGTADRTVLMSGHSKGFAMTGWRLGWVILPTVEEAAVFTRLNINTISCVPPFIQEAGRTAYESPESLTTTGDMVRAFEERRDWVVPALNRIDGIRCQMPRGAFYVFPNVADTCDRLGILSAWDALPEDARSRTSPSAILQMFLLYRYGVATMDRNSFGVIGSEGQHFLRLSIATSLERLRTGVARLAEAAGDREGFRSFMDEERLWDAPAD